MPMGMDFSKHYNHLVNEEKEKVKVLENKFAEKLRAANVSREIVTYQIGVCPGKLI